MAKPSSAAISVNNKIYGAPTGPGQRVTGVGNSTMGTSGVAQFNSEFPRYPVSNVEKPSRADRARVGWNKNKTPSGQKSDAYRIVVDCGEPVAADVIGLIDCNATSGKARFYGSNNASQFQPYWAGQEPVAITGTPSDVIFRDVQLGRVGASGLNVDYPDPEEWQWASRAQLNYFSYINSSSYNIPSGSTYILPGGLVGGSDRRNHQGRAYGSKYFDGSSAIRPHMFTKPPRYILHSSTSYGDYSNATSTITPIIAGSRDFIGDEEQWQYNQLRGVYRDSSADLNRGRGGQDPIWWYTTDYRTDTDGANGLWQVNGATKPVGFKATPESPISGSLVLRRDSGAAVGSGTFVATVGAKLETTGTGTWWNLFARGGSTLNYEGVWVAKGLGAAGTIRVLHWQPQSHPGDVFYWDVPDTYLGDWHVWQIIRKGSGAEKLSLAIDGVVISDIDVNTWTGGETASFAAINAYRLGHNYLNTQITALDSSAVFGKTSIAYFSLMDWGYAVNIPSGLDALKYDAGSEYQQASFDLGLRQDDLKRRFWCVEFDELRGDMGISGEYLELGGIWVGDRIDIDATGPVEIQNSRRAVGSAESYGGAIGYEAGGRIREVQMSALGYGMSNSSELAETLCDSSFGRVVVDTHASVPENRGSGLFLGAAEGARLSMRSLSGSTVGLAMSEDSPFAAYGYESYSSPAGFSALYGGVDSAGKVAMGSLFVRDSLIQPGQRAHFMVSFSGSATPRVVGPASGAALMAGFLRPSYDPTQGLPGPEDWEIGVNVFCQEGTNGISGWDSTRALSNSFQSPWNLNGAVLNGGLIATGDMFSFGRAISLDYQSTDNKAVGKFGPGNTDPTSAVGGLSQTSSAIYGARRLALYWYHDPANYPAGKFNVGDFPTVSVITIP